MAVNFSKHQEEITKAWAEICQDKNTERWALFDYEGKTNIIRLVCTGTKGLDELVEKFHISSIQYACCRVVDETNDVNKLILINWQGESAPLSRKGLCASHVSDVSGYFRGCNQTITLRNEDDATREYILSLVFKRSSRVSILNSAKSTSVNQTKLNQRNEDDSKDRTTSKVNIIKELDFDRKSFWHKQEEEEKQRLEDEKKKAAEKQAFFEKERTLKEAALTSMENKLKQNLNLNEAAKVIPNQQSNDHNDEDDRYGRRSELLRQERSQETSSVISKGLIKDKKALFEQACSNQSISIDKTSTTYSTARKNSNTKISQRLNAFEPSNSVANDVKEVSKNFVKTNGVVADKVSTVIVSDVKTNDDDEISNLKKVDVPNLQDIQENSSETNANTLNKKKVDETSDVNGNEQEILDVISNGIEKEIESIKESPLKKSTTPETYGNNGICVKAVYDYQAADDTEVSFDPEDIIGYIEKVDEGWWQGKVLTGIYAGQVGLFPSNYVEEV